MANCPKCGEHLRLIDWKQHCPHCGANIFIYDLQERLMQDADKAEVQNYHFQKKIDRLKASFAGSKLAVARIFTSILPIGGLFLPLINGKLLSPLPETSGGIDILKIVNTVSAEGLDAGAILSSLTSSIPMLISVLLFVMSAVLILLHLILLTLSCSPKGKIRNFTLDILMIAFSVGSAVCFALSPADFFIQGSLSVGTYVYIALIIVNFIIDFAVFKKGIEIKHKQAFVGGIPIEEYFQMVNSGVSHEDIRKEQYKRLQAIYDEKVKELEEHEKENGEAAVNG